MDTRTGFSVIARLQSVAYALNGIGFMLRHQHNAWLHLAASVIVVGLAWALGVSAGDWRWLIVAMAMVWVAETFNTAVEYLCNVVSPQYSEAVKRTKDFAAGAVLICAAAAVVIGLTTLWPYLV
jgi:diacylglycerol kinase